MALPSLFLFLIISLAVPLVYGACSMSTVKLGEIECSSSEYQFFNSTKDNFTAEAYPSVCSAFKLYVTCIEPHILGCPEDLVAHIRKKVDDEKKKYTNYPFSCRITSSASCLSTFYITAVLVVLTTILLTT